MANSVYRVTEIIGTSTKSWEDAAKQAVETAAKSLRDLRVAEVSDLDMTIENVPSAENPGTGRLTPLSILATLLGLVEPLRVGC